MIAKEAGKYREIRKITEKAMRGKIDYESAFFNRINKLKGLKRKEVLNVVERIELREGIKEFIDLIKQEEGEPIIVTDGYDLIARRIGNEIGINEVHANRLEFKNEKLAGANLDVNGKGKIFDRIIKEKGIHKTMAIGDGANDLGMFQKADLGIGFWGKNIIKKRFPTIKYFKGLLKLLRGERNGFRP